MQCTPTTKQAPKISCITWHSGDYVLCSLQRRLAGLGLSSLGRAESHVLSTVDTVLEVLYRLTGGTCRPSPEAATVIDNTDGERLLVEHTDDLLGLPSSGRGVRIMVTMPGEAANDYTLVHTLLQQGMDCMRINCAHDEAPAWSRMIEHLKRAEQAIGRSCRIVMDLAGPKLRTGPLQPGFSVIRIVPTCDVYGRVVAPARVWLFAQSDSHQPSSPADASLPVPPKWLARLRPADDIRPTHARDAKRTWQVVDVTKDGCWAEATKTTYIVPGTVLDHEHRAGKKHERQARVAQLPHGKNTIVLQQADQLILTRDLTPGRPATHDSGGKVLTPAMIGCTIPEVFNDVRSGEAIWFDDGKIGGVIEKMTDDQAYIRITHARVGGQNLCGDKGINLPESDLRLAALTAKDLEDLSFAAQHADVVELSFANSARDVELLQQHLCVSLGAAACCRAQNRNASGVQEFTRHVADGHAGAMLWSDDCPGRPRRRVWVRALGGSSRRNPLDL